MCDQTDLYLRQRPIWLSFRPNSNAVCGQTFGKVSITPAAFLSWPCFILSYLRTTYGNR